MPHIPWFLHKSNNAVLNLKRRVKSYLIPNLWSRQGELESLLMSVLTSTPNRIFKSVKGQGLCPFVESPCERKNLQCNLPQMSMNHSLQNLGTGLSPATAPKCCRPKLARGCRKPKPRVRLPFDNLSRERPMSPHLLSPRFRLALLQL